MAICSTSVRVVSVSANTPPPALMTNVLPLYMRMYGAALRSARMARAWSLRFNIMSSGSFEHSIQHSHLHSHAVVRLFQYRTARAVQDLVRNGGITSHGQAVHQPAIGRSAGK